MPGVCRNTGKHTDDCRCLECKPETLTFSEIIGEPETIEDILKRVNFETSLRFKLLAMEGQDYVIDRIATNHLVFKRLSREGFYWMRCDCGNIVEAPVGGSWTEACQKCNPQASGGNEYRRISILIILFLLPILVGLLWLMFSGMGILPTLDWPLTLIPLFLVGAPVLFVLITFQMYQYRLKKKRRILRECAREVVRR